MITYTTCRRCGGLLHITNGETVHPLCDPKPTKVEHLTDLWLAAVNAGDEFRADAHEYDIEHIDNQPPRLLAAALKYAAVGWPVFPLKPHAKTPATKNGFKDATTNPDQIYAWWTKAPDQNIGLPTGHAFDVIDVDVPTGFTSMDTLDVNGHLPNTHGRVSTSSGGVHFYVPPTGDGNRAGILPGIDYRGVGGYVVAPPSTLGVRGRAWTWSQYPSPVLTDHQKARAAA